MRREKMFLFSYLESLILVAFYSQHTVIKSCLAKRGHQWGCRVELAWFIQKYV